MANTIAGDLVVDLLASKVITKLQNAFAPLSSFASDFSDEVVSGRTSIQVPLVTAAGTTLTNPTDFEQTDATISNVNVATSHYSQPFSLTSRDVQNGKRLEWLAEGQAGALANKIKGVVNALITTAYTNTPVVVAQASFAAANARTLWASLKSGKKVLVLDSVAFSQLLPSDLNAFPKNSDGSLSGLAGFDAIYNDTYWTDVGVAGVYGFAATPNALAMVGRIPDVAPAVGSQLMSKTVSLPNGLAVQVNMWGSTQSRAVHVTYDIEFGAARGDVTALTYVDIS